MRTRDFTLLVALLLGAAPASAQPSKSGKAGAAPARAAVKSTPPSEKVSRPAAEEKEKEKEKPAAAESAADAETAAPNADSELGAPPKPTDADGSTKLSPLTPAPDEFPKGPPPAAPADLDRLLGDIATLRSRVSALTTTLFKSQLRVVIETRGDDSRIESLNVTLDDGVVFVAPERFSADDDRTVYEHALAPGQHVLGVDVERYDARNRQYRTWQSSRFSIVVPESQLVEAHVRIGDSSDMAVDFPDDKDGEYDVRVRLRARVTAR
jgi:hypothetical protein